MKKKRLHLVLILSLALLLLVSSCTKASPPTDGNTTEDTTGETMGESTTAETDGTDAPRLEPLMTLKDYDDLWYLSYDPMLLSSKSQYEAFLQWRTDYRARETEKRYFTKTPVIYETDYTVDGIALFHYRCDFFKEYYEHDELLQIRITVTNVTEEIRNFKWSPDAAVDLLCDGEQGGAPFFAYTEGLFYPTFENKLRQEYPSGDAAVYPLLPGESVVIERALPLTGITGLPVSPNGEPGGNRVDGVIRLRCGFNVFDEIPIQMFVFDKDDPAASAIDPAR